MKTVHVVNAVLTSEVGEVLTARRSAAKPVYGGKWSFPGGHVEKGERFHSALKRETSEELGVRILKWRYLCSVTNPPCNPLSSVKFHFYRVSSWFGEPKLCGDEHTELRWIPRDAAIHVEDFAFFQYQNIIRLVRTYYKPL